MVIKQLQTIFSKAYPGIAPLIPLLIIGAILVAVPLTVRELEKPKPQTNLSSAQGEGGGGGASKGNIGGQVWRDTDLNGSKGSNEAGFALVKITATGPVQRTVSTNITSGSYFMGDLPVGTYKIQVQKPKDVDGKTYTYTTDRTITRDVKNGQTVVASFGIGVKSSSGQPTIAPTGTQGDGNDEEGTETVAGDVFLDSDGDGKRDGNEGWLATTVELQTTGGDTLSITNSNTDGDFKFTGVAPGSYVLRASYGDGVDEAVVNVTEGFTIKTRLGIRDTDSSGGNNGGNNNGGNNGGNDGGSNGGNNGGNNNNGGETETKVNLTVIAIDDTTEKALKDVRVGVDPDGAGYKYTNASGNAVFPVTQNTTVSINAYKEGYEIARFSGLNVTKARSKTMRLVRTNEGPTPTAPVPTKKPSVTPTTAPSSLGRKADIIVSSFRLTDSAGNIKTKFAENEPIYALVSFKNTGTERNYSFAGHFISSIYADCPTPKTEDTVSDIGMSLTTPLIDPNLTVTFGSTNNGENSSFFRGNRSFKKDEAGTYTACAYANYSHSAREKDFTNNQKTIKYTITDNTPPPVTPTVTPTPTTVVKKMTISGFVFIDANQNSNYDEDIDYKVPASFGYQIRATNLSTNATLTPTTKDNGNGSFAFTDIPQGTYRVSYTNPPQNYRITMPQSSSYTLTVNEDGCDVQPQLEIKCSQNGVTDLSFGTSVNFTNPTFTPTPIASSITPPSGTPPTATLTPPVAEETRLTLSFTLSGITGPGSSTASASRTITAEALDFSRPNSEAVEGEGPLTFDATSNTFKGAITFDEPLSPGSYLINVKTQKYEARLLAGTLVVAPDGTASIANVTQPIRLLAGDVDNDGNLTIFDYNILAGCMRTLGTTTPAGCSEETLFNTDLNEDGVVDQIDYNIFLRSVRESALNPSTNQ